MNEDVIVEKTGKILPKGAGGTKNLRRFTTGEKLKAGRLHLHEGFTMTLVIERQDNNATPWSAEFE